MTARPGDEKAAATRRGQMRASHADREQAIDALKAAFVQERLTKDEFDARIGQTLASRTYAELITVTADIPTGSAGTQPARRPPRRPMSRAARWGAYGFVTPAILALAFTLAGLGGGGGFGAVGLLIARRLFPVLAVQRGQHALGMALHVFADGKNVRPMRAHRRVSPRAGVLHRPAGGGETLHVRGLCSAGNVTRDRRPEPATD